MLSMLLDLCFSFSGNDMFFLILTFYMPVVNAVVDTLAQVASAEVLPENSDNQTEGVDDYVPEPSFAVGKSPSQNGLSTVEMPTGTGGLGEGTPKVLLLPLNYN